METIRKNVEGSWELAPKYVRKILNIECSDKQTNHSYKEYVQIKHSNFSECNWRRLCPNWRYRELFQDKTSPDDMDTTELFALFFALFQTKYEESECKELKTKLEAVKDIRNEIAHEHSAIRNPSKLPELHNTLLELIQVAGKFYKLSRREVKALEFELRSDISRGFSPSDMEQTYFSHCLCNEGKENVRLILQNFTNDLSCGVGHLKLSADFYPLKLTLPHEDDKKYPYTEVFESVTKVVVVSGVAAAGKTTLLKNLIKQFFGLQCEVPDYLQSFDILVFIECRDDTKNKLHQVFREHFGNVYSKIDKENVMQTLSYLRVLFLVDAFDEANGNSMAVLRELFQKTWHSESRIIITTRPKAIEELEQFIRQSSFTHFSITPLSELAEQLEFIRGCKQNLTNDPSSCAAMQDRFSKLNPEVRNLITLPISLLQFCTIFLTSPKMIDNWNSAKDLSRDTLMLYKTVIERKLCDLHVPDRSVLINKIFKVIGKSALKYLSMDKMAFSKDEFLLFERECHDQMTAHNAAMAIDSKVFLSLIFTVKRNFPGTTGATYSFNHKSIQEKFAALFVIEELENDKSLHEILGTSQAIKTSFLDVLPYVMQDLSSSPLLFKRHWPELREVITETGLYSCDDWQNLLLQGPGLIELAKHVAKITITATDEWTVRSVCSLVAVSLMLPHEQPRLINIKLPPAELAAADSSWSGLTSLYRGQLELHLEDSSVATRAPCEDLLGCLKGSRCLLTELVGSISSAASVSAVASVSTAATTELSISLSAPLNLNALQGKYKSLVAKIRPLEDSWASVLQPTRFSLRPEKQDDGFETREPDAAEGRLPAYPPPQLWVLDAKPGSRETIARAICTIAPHTRRLGKIRLPKCGLEEDEVWQLLLQLHSDGIRSIGGGQTRFTKNGEGLVELFVADDLPDFFWTASAVQQVIAQLQSRDAGDFEAQWPELRRAMEEAGASARHWWEVLLSRPHEPALAEFAARITRKEDEQFIIQSRRDLEAVALMLPYAEDTLVKVKASLEALRSPAWKQVLKHHTGGIHLKILDTSPDFTPCDDVLQPLICSSSELKSFQGHIRTDAGIAALASAAAASASIHIRVEAPLNLSALHGKYAELRVCTPVLDTAVAAAPLPALPLPVLQVLSPGAGTWEDVAKTVLIYAPRCKKFLGIELCQSALSEEEERLLLMLLHERNIRTNDAGATRTEPHGAHKRRLRLCEDPPATYSP
ncbi:uncharacterized protein LOC108666490 [Hyalella azteca]|uniref:Uncharacterized protein LOC108666490 n=1 Tax=Hyalella azteca TaxID=294128 RepID=A0A8B7N6F9_HYAAZ|nr:uncharacterized protein LOC108666490 [Hyalella azteca]